MRLSTGSMKAAVLPLPVCEETIRSSPVKARGMAAACTGVGWLKPARSSADNRVGESPRDSKDMLTFAEMAVMRARAIKGRRGARVRGSSCRPNQPRCTGKPCAALRQGSGRSGCDGARHTRLIAALRRKYSSLEGLHPCQRKKNADHNYIGETPGKIAFCFMRLLCCCANALRRPAGALK